MFRLVDFRNVGGKIRMTVETDDTTTVLMLRLFSQADKFAQLFHYRYATSLRIDTSQKSQSEKMGQLRIYRARLLQRFREIPEGSHHQKLKILQEMNRLEGIDVTQDRLSAQLQMALQEEKEGKMFSIKRLIKKGKTLDEIASSLGMSKSTVSRYLKSVRGAKQSPALKSLSVLAIAECPPEPSSTSEPPSTLPSPKSQA